MLKRVWHFSVKSRLILRFLDLRLPRRSRLGVAPTTLPRWNRIEQLTIGPSEVVCGVE